jgi:outer membrane protein TolC
VGVDFHWTLFDGGKRHMSSAAAESRQKEHEDELREQQERITREIWSAYLGFRTAMRKHEAAISLEHAARISYDSSFEAYKLGVKNFVDVSTAEKLLSEAEFTLVEAKSSVWLSALQLEYTSGHLLRTGKPVAEGAVR